MTPNNMKKKQQEKRSALKRGMRTAKMVTVAADIGAVVGAAAGLLSAPKKGSELRREAARGATALKKRSAAAEREFERAFKRLPPESQRALRSARRRLVKELAMAKERLTKASYHDMVDAAFTAASKGKKELSDAAAALKSEWKRSYDRLKKHL